MAAGKEITPSSSGGGTWPGEPPRLREEHVDLLLLWCVQQRASDVTIQTDRPVYIEQDGALKPATIRPADAADVATILGKIYGPDALAKLAAGVDLDLSYEVWADRYHRVRFRVNATAILSRGRDTAQITMRALPTEPPTMKALGVEQEIIDAWAPRQGLVMITGPTGSGKTTLLAAGNRMLIERPGGCGKMLTYEAPIEYVFDSVQSASSLIAQTEIPRHLPSFAAGVRNALRRKPSIILVGEARDRETVAAAVEAAQTGHAVYSTAHTTGVAATIRRMVSVFAPGERTERSYALMETLRLIITQTLLPRVGGGRIGVREWMIFPDEVREKMLDMPHERWTYEVQRIIPQYGRTMAESARRLFDEGLIERRGYLTLANGYSEGGA